jgi:hypothetical protein
MRKEIDWNTFLFRSSGVSNIMSGNIGLSESQKRDLDGFKELKDKPNGLTDKQLEKLQQDHYKEKLTPKQEESMIEVIKSAVEIKGLTPAQQDKFNEYSALEKDKSLPVGVQSYLKKLYREVTYNRRKKLESKYILKGNLQEEEAITMYSLFTGEIFMNNKERVNNEYITGEYDMYSGDDIDHITEGYDTKCSFDLSTFPFPEDSLDINYYYQNMSYMWLSGSDKWTTVYCLTNTPDKMLKDMIYREDFRWDGDDAPMSAKLDILNTNVFDDETFATMMMIHDCAPDPESETEDNMKCVDTVLNFVPMELKERIVEKVVYRDEAVITEMKLRVKLCRKFLLTLSKSKQ